ncbi:response regulator [Geothrix sp. PMB-07]|uniref:response regulator n=1 Tax=Geothrix sp. PMB-07 TaxID=3068640 RepID=UPI002740CF1A|nr:response regulator [Geothrix sp. PMB-07]WLT33258.1 response regulator [Geothrix sp. PMB-07]
MSTVLVVDDDPSVREVLKAFVEREGHRVLEAADASFARKALAKEHVDLMFLDVLMPGESGSALCHSLKDDPECQGIKVVLLTGFNGERAWQQGLRSGADIFLVKPVNYERIKVLLEELLSPGDQA